MFSHFIFWPWFVGLLFLIVGLILAQMGVTGVPWLERVIALGPVFFAAPLAVFGTEHLVGAQFMKTMVPEYMPGRLFWIYFVGIALLCAATSIISRRYISVASMLLGLMFFLFVIQLHIYRVVMHPNDRFSWAVALRDVAFGGAAWVLAGCRSPKWRESAGLIATGRFAVAIPVLFFGVEHFLHPYFAPGVPLEKAMPAFVPFPALWSYLTGALLIATGIAILSKKLGRRLSVSTGMLIAFLVLFIYSPLLARASKPSEMNQAVNYVADTLLVAGALLIVAEASAVEHSEVKLKSSAATA